MQSTTARHMLGCARLSLQTSKRTYITTSLCTGTTWKRTPIQQQHPQTAALNTTFHRPRTAWLIGSVRQHGTHGHHHHDADLMASLKSSSKKGTRITIIGLASNVGLTIAKGAAGWVMNSASLLAEALHSFSGK
ncbi:uncharacterized protein ATC70_008931 [Mucor velutinosus]|uniref:Cation efflux protein transmembrane domain-containing protein n=1 Tax=Mucor velutinosus TaxID=708070 RepID=A0AAN7DLP8_9FUNG|nr:hypothetical protein ATC70_008931 [Mucor velutinosus]